MGHVHAAQSPVLARPGRRPIWSPHRCPWPACYRPLGDGVYAATKHAAVGFAEWMAITYAAQGIRVSCVCPGAVNTAMLAGSAGGDVEKAAAAIGGGDVLQS